MSKNQIVEKLNTHLQNSVFDEPLVMYFMIQFRKVIEYLNLEKQAPLLKFYCDWVVHTRKDKITSEMSLVFEEMYEELKLTLAGPMPGLNEMGIKFIQMNDVRQEISGLCQKINLEDFTQSNILWNRFVQSLIKILEDQPIIKPIPEIEKCIFESSQPGLIVVTVTLASQIKNYPSRTVRSAFYILNDQIPVPYL